MVTLRTKLAVFVAILACALSAGAGDAAPNLELRDLQGAKHSLADYHGKPVLLNFWATWCVPCAAEMPLLSKMQKQYQDKVLFIAASIDDEDMKPQIEAFIKKHQGEALTVMMGATLDSLDDFGVNQGMPGTVFIDAEGNIVDRVSGALKRPDLEQRLRKLVGEQEPSPTPRATPKNASKPSRKKVVPRSQEIPSLTSRVAADPRRHP
ncbi:MAG TPA: TlpA disulfide reductase family protein [Candidatus Angelobacter sp.]|jgi:thiol-disulfide isomerase/thioredoxin|nr:TlpA disulfide reductase family protein [Candidatus Angelobacter sp.]